MWSFLFRKQPDAPELLRWLHSIIDSLQDLEPAEMAKGKSFPGLLALFTLTTTSRCTYGVIEQVPSTASKVGPVFRELRAYFDCLWQLELLRRCDTPDDEQKVGKLYAGVGFRTMFIANYLFEAHPRMKRILECAFDGSYNQCLGTAVREYVQGRREFPVAETGDLLKDNVEALTIRVARHGNPGSRALPTLKAILTDHTTKALDLVYLRDFDFANCEPISFPPEWLDPP